MEINIINVPESLYAGDVIVARLLDTVYYFMYFQSNENGEIEGLIDLEDGNEYAYEYANCESDDNLANVKCFINKIFPNIQIVEIIKNKNLRLSKIN